MAKRRGKGPASLLPVSATVVLASLALLAADPAAAQNGGPQGGVARTPTDLDPWENEALAGIFGGVFFIDSFSPEAEYIAAALGVPTGSVTYTGAYACSNGTRLLSSNKGMVVSGDGYDVATLRNVNIVKFAFCGNLIVALDSIGNLWASADCGLHFTKVVPAGLPTGSGGNALSDWLPCENSNPSARNASLASSPSVLLLGFGATGVYRSTDGGQTFTPSNSGLPAGSVTASVFLSAAGKLFVGTGSGVYASADQGSSWTAANTGLPSGSAHVQALATDGANIYASVDNTAIGTQIPNGAIYKSVNGGASWTITGYSGKPDAFNWLLASSKSVLAGTTLGLFQSTDGGATWSAVDKGRVQTNILAVAAQGNSVVAGADGIPNAAFGSSDGGFSWQGATGLAGVQISGLVETATSVVGVGPFGAFRSTNGGLTWTPASGFPVPGGGSPPVVTSSGGTLLATNYKDLYRSVDDGVSWSRFDGNLNTAVSYYGFSSIAAVGNALFIGAGVFNQGLLRSLDGGNSWQACAGAPTENFIAIGGSGANVYAYSSTSSKLYRSADGGGSFAQVAAAGLDSKANVLLVSGATLIAGTNFGLRSSVDGGVTFSVFAPEIPGPVRALAVANDKLYAGTGGRGVWGTSIPADARRVIPVVLDVISGTAHFTTELVLTNRGSAPVNAALLYTASAGSGTGTVNAAVAPGQQLVIPDAIAYLRQNGVAIPTSGSQVGTVSILFTGLSSPDVVAAIARTTSATQAPQPVGSAGLAYPGVEPGGASTDSLWIYGLRQNDTDRSNLAVYNPTSFPVTVKVTAFSGDGISAVVATADVLPSWGWKQYNGVMAGVGNQNGYAKIERVSTSSAFLAYGVVNDNGTNDGSFVPPAAALSLEGYFNVPVLVETSAFVSELVLANQRTVATPFTLTYTESLSPSGGTGGTATVTLSPGEQRIIPGAIDFMRKNGASIGAPGPAYAGSLHVDVAGPLLNDVFVGARTASPSPGGGQFGLFYGANPPQSEGLGAAYLYGLRSDANNRSNVAVLNTAPAGSGSVTLSLQAYDGNGGGAAAGSAESISLAPGQWTQYGNFLATKGVSNGWVQVTRTLGSAPWIAYGVINDGGAPGQRTGDGAYIPMVK